MSDPNENFVQGYMGGPTPSGPGAADYAAGDLARKFNEQRLKQNQDAWTAQVPVEEYKPVHAPPVQYNWVDMPREAGRHVSPLVGLPLALCIGLPLYHYSIPLWMALYPAAAVIAGLVTLAVFLGLGSGGGLTLEGRLVVGGIFGFVAGAVLTVAEQARAVRKSYRQTRHVIRLGLIFLWAVYALTLWESHPGIGFPPLSHTWAAAWTPLHVVIAAIVVVVMHFWLSTNGAAGRAWQRLRGKAGRVVGG